VENAGQITSAARPRPDGTRSPRALEKGEETPIGAAMLPRNLAIENIVRHIENGEPLTLRWAGQTRAGFR
jgi:hypothetical protein